MGDARLMVVENWMGFVEVVEPGGSITQTDSEEKTSAMGIVI